MKVEEMDIEIGYTFEKAVLAASMHTYSQQQPDHES